MVNKKPATLQVFHYPDYPSTELLHSYTIIAPQGHFRRAGRSYLVGSEPVTVEDLLCWLVTYFDLCATRGGSAVRRAFGNRVELAN